MERLAERRRPKAGIIIPDTAKEKPMEGKVIAGGEREDHRRRQLLKLDVKPAT